MKKFFTTLAVLLSFMAVQAQEFVNMSDRPGYVALKKWGRNQHDVTLRNPVRFSDGTRKKLYGVGPHAFEGLTSLGVVTFYEGEFETEEVVLGNECFKGCTSLQYLTLPQNIRKIPYGCFRDCTGLLFFRLPNDVETIEDFAFAGCTQLQTIQTLAPTPKRLKSGGNLAFQGVLIVPKGHGDFYTDPANGWSDYFPRVREDGATEDYKGKASAAPYMKITELKYDVQGNHYNTVKPRELLVTAVIETNIKTDLWVNIHFSLADGKNFTSTNPAWNRNGKVMTSEKVWDYQGNRRKVTFRIPYMYIYGNYGAKQFRWWLSTSTTTKIDGAKMDKTKPVPLTITNVPRPRK